MTQIQVDDAELAKLMAELEASTGVVSAPVTPPAPPAPPPSELSSDDLSELDSLDPDNSGLDAAANELAELAAMSGTTVTGPVGESLVETEVPAVPATDLDAALAELETEVAAPAPAVKAKPEPDLASELAALQAETLAAPTPAPAPAPAAVPTPAAPVLPVAAAVLPVVPASLADAINAEMSGAPAPSNPMVAPLRHQIDPAVFKAETAINDTNLDKCFMEQSALRAYYGTETVKAEAQYNRVKRKFEVIEAKLYDEHRRLLAEAGEAKITEKMVENAVKSDPRWELASDRVIEAESIFGVAKALTVSLADRRDMLIQLGANARDESKGQARVLAAQNARDSLAERAMAAVQAAS